MNIKKCTQLLNIRSCKYLRYDLIKLKLKNHWEFDIASKYPTEPWGKRIQEKERRKKM